MRIVVADYFERMCVWIIGEIASDPIVPRQALRQAIQNDAFFILFIINVVTVKASLVIGREERFAIRILASPQDESFLSASGDIRDF